MTLPEKQRIVFNLRYYDELEYEDIARVLDSKVETLKVNYHYAKDKIKEYYIKQGNIMDKDFDFDNIGKRTPYRTPDNFFEETQRKILERTVGEQRKKRRLKRIIPTVIAVAAVLAGILFTPSLRYMNTDTPSASNILAVDKIM